ncbi:hypothetical protein U9M48_039202, partial [Paspalum notatum var. saurae]
PLLSPRLALPPRPQAEAPVWLKSHLGTYLCVADDAEAVSHGYRRNSRGTVWAVEPAGDEYIRLRGHRGLYLGAADPAAALTPPLPSAGSSRVCRPRPTTAPSSGRRGGIRTGNARPPPYRAQSCDAHLEATAAMSDTASIAKLISLFCNWFVRCKDDANLISSWESKTKLEEPPPIDEPLHMPPPRACR